MKITHRYKNKPLLLPLFNLTVSIEMVDDLDTNIMGWAIRYDPFIYEVVIYIVKRKWNDAIAIVAHESSHLADYYFQDIAEDKPSDEFKAYAVGTFVNMINQHIEKLRNEENN